MDNSSLCKGCGKFFTQMKTPDCGWFQWMEAHPSDGVCKTPQCLSCGKIYCFLSESYCQSCEQINTPGSNLSAQAPATNPSDFCPTRSIGSTPSTAGSLPQELFCNS
ncbi:hypothetical protein DFH28DRAFT_899221 [Melampsora americana]|nr:hypothetical protein DFH28DRAFT_899221 [Melampsora americana]